MISRLIPTACATFAADPAHRALRERLSKALDAHMISIHDNGFLPEGVAGEGWDASRDCALYPLEQVMILARTAALGRAGSLPALRAALAKLGETQVAVPALAELCGETQPWQIRLHAINALTYLGKAARALSDHSGSP